MSPSAEQWDDLFEDFIAVLKSGPLREMQADTVRRAVAEATKFTRPRVRGRPAGSRNRQPAHGYVRTLQYFEALGAGLRPARAAERVADGWFDPQSVFKDVQRHRSRIFDEMAREADDIYFRIGMDTLVENDLHAWLMHEISGALEESEADFLGRGFPTTRAGLDRLRDFLEYRVIILFGEFVADARLRPDSGQS